MMQLADRGMRLALLGAPLLLASASIARGQGEDTPQNTDPRTETAESDWVARMESPAHGVVLVTRLEFQRHLLKKYASVFRGRAQNALMVLPEILNGLSAPILKEEIKALINHKLLVKAMKDDAGATIDEETLDKHIKDDRDRVKRNYRGQFTLEEILSRQGTTLQEYRENLKVSLWLEKKLEAEITTAKLRAYFLQWHRHYSGKMALVGQIYIKAYDRNELIAELKEVEEEKPMTVAQRRKWWSDHVRDGWAEAAKKLGVAQTDVKKTSFADAARRHSDDPSAKDSGGTIGWVRMKGQLRPELVEAVFSAKDGTLTRPVQLESSEGGGFHLLFVYQIYEPKDMIQLADVEDGVREEMRLEKQTEFLKKLRKDAVMTYRIGEEEEPEGIPPVKEE